MCGKNQDIEKIHTCKLKITEKVVKNVKKGTTKRPDVMQD